MPIVCLLAVVCACSLDIREYLSEERDKLYFGVGGGVTRQQVTPYYLWENGATPFYTVLFGVGDYPVVFDVRYRYSNRYYTDRDPSQRNNVKEYSVGAGGLFYPFRPVFGLSPYAGIWVVGKNEKRISRYRDQTSSLAYDGSIVYGYRLACGADFLHWNNMFLSLSGQYEKSGSSFGRDTEQLGVACSVQMGE